MVIPNEIKEVLRSHFNSDKLITKFGVFNVNHLNSLDSKSFFYGILVSSTAMDVQILNYDGSLNKLSGEWLDRSVPYLIKKIVGNGLGNNNAAYGYIIEVL
jgi:hypothetical protein